MIRIAYTLLLFIASPILLFSLYKKKSDKPPFGARWKEHFGFTPPIKSKNPIWIHAVSVGESIAAIPVIKELKKQNPSQAIIVTTTTSTGAKQIERLGEIVEHRFMPIDFAWCVRRFIKTVQPSQLLIIETELWPNTLKVVYKQGIKTTVINARLSERSCLRYQKFSHVFNLIRPYVNKVLCQYDSDAERFLRLGFEPTQVETTGSIKFDIEISSSVKIEGQQLRQQLGAQRPIWIAASTHEGEDSIILDAHQNLLASHPDALLLLVPRHPERFSSVFELCIEKGFKTERRTSSMGSTDCLESYQVYLGDTMGEMLLLLAAADVCFMGGSLVGDKVGGHNLLEPAALGIPLLNGPSYYNFNEIMQLLQENEAVTLCDNSQQITEQLKQLFANAALMCDKGMKARQVVENNRGAIAKTVHAIVG